jgi:enoyl-CoA hydratase/carnithine racemase
MAEELLVERREAVGWLTLNRTNDLNTLNWQLLKSLDAGLTEMLADQSVRTIVLTGAGRAFCAGADLKFIEALPQQERNEATAAFLLAATTLISRMAASSKPTIAAVNGVAVGGGLELLLACDIIIAVRGAPIGDGHANYGLFPGAGSSIRLPRRVGIGRAKQLLFTGELLPAERMAEFGLVNEVVEPAELHARADAIANAIARKSPIGLAHMKQIVEHAFDMSEQAGLAFEQALSNLHTTSFDRNEGLAAFRERRQPNFVGR